MSELIKNIQEWLEELQKTSLPSYDDLPDVSLYMDQTVSYIDEVLKPYSRDEKDAITSFMVNNYVKAKIIDAPYLKRYNKNQLSYLIAICLLKQSTSMANLSVLLNKNNFKDDYKGIYDVFTHLHDSKRIEIGESTRNELKELEKGVKTPRSPSRGKIKKKVDESVKESDDNKLSSEKIQLLMLSLKLMIDSQINKTISERILYELGKEIYDNPALFEEKHKEIKYERKRTKKETKRIKKVNSR